MSAKKVAVVFATYNRLPLLKKAVESVRHAVGNISYDIVAVDGGSADGSREWLAAQKDVVLIGQRGPLSGAVKAFNMGFSYAVENGYDQVFHFNDDAEIRRTSVMRHPIDHASRILDRDKSIGEVAFEFDLRGEWAFEKIHGKTYGNFGLIRTEAGIAVAKAQGDPSGQKWWNPIYRTYGADTEFGCWLWKLGWSVYDGKGLRVHDVNAKDELRVLNGANDPNRKDSKIFWDRWSSAESMRPKHDSYSVNWSGARVHVGCGEKKLRGWINVDALQCPAADVVMDFSEGVKRIPSGALREVYWSHGPEHVHPDKLPGMLREIRRSLAPGGRLTVGTIDLVGIIENRFKTSRNGSNWNSALYGETDSKDPIWASHKQAFTEEYLSNILRDAGFVGMRKWQPEESHEIAELNDYTTSCRLVTIAIVCEAPVGKTIHEPEAEADESVASAKVADERRWDESSLRNGVIVPAYGSLPPRAQKPKEERVLHVALRTPQEPQAGLERALRSISVAYSQVDWLSEERLGPDAVASSILSGAAAIKPTIVFMQLQRETFVTPGLIAELRKLCDKNVVIINWDGDQHFEPADAGRRWFVELGKACDSSLVVNTKHPAEYAQLGVANPGYLQIGVDSEVFRQAGNAVHSVSGGGNVVLLASNYSSVRSYDRRAMAVTMLQSFLGANFNVYGHGWSGLACGRNLVHTSEEAYVYARAAASLSISIRNDLSRYTSDRLFRSMACGSVTIVESFPDCHGLGLRHEKNCILWDGNMSNLKEVVHDVLSMRERNQGAVMSIRHEAAKVGLEEHSWDSRMGDLAAIVGIVRSKKEVT